MTREEAAKMIQGVIRIELDSAESYARRGDIKRAESETDDAVRKLKGVVKGLLDPEA